MDGRFWNRVKLSPQYIKLTHWEFWPFYILYIPVFFYFIWLALKARSLLFFTASNPGVDTGGMFGESKWSVLQKVPPSLIPKTILVKPGAPFTHTLKRLENAGIKFPLIAKPDIGERGFLVEKIDDAASLEKYLSKFKVDFLLQEYVDYDHEYNVLYYKKPGEQKGKITSVTIKRYLSVTGDGGSTVRELMKMEMHAFLQVERFKKEKPHLMNYVPANGEMVRVEPIGNHVRGATFFDGRNMADERMTAAFDSIANQISGMNIFRFDVKCEKQEDVKSGKVKIVELNGSGGEPTHIYETGYPLWRAWGDLLHQWKIIDEVSRMNHGNGIPYMPLTEGVAKFRAYLNYKRQVG